MFCKKKKDQKADYNPAYFFQPAPRPSNTYRPCWVDGRKALFHRWADSARPVKGYGQEEDDEATRYQLHNVQAIVEFVDGTVRRFWPHEIQFADHRHFLDYDWGPESEEA